MDDWHDDSGWAKPLRKSETGYVGKGAKDGSREIYGKHTAEEAGV